MSNLIKKLIDFEMKASSDLQLQFFLLSAIRQNRVRSKKMHQKNGKKYDIQFITIQTLNPIRNTISACQKIFNFFSRKKMFWELKNEKCQMKIFCKDVETLNEEILNLFGLECKVQTQFKECYNTGGPRYMRSFYLQFRIYAIQKWPFFWNLSSNLW